MGFSRQEYWSGLPFPSPGDLPNPGIQPESPALAGRFFTTEPPGKPTWSSDQIRSVAQSCPTHCDPMNRSTPGLPVHHQPSKMGAEWKSEIDYLTHLLSPSCQHWWWDGGSKLLQSGRGLSLVPCYKSWAVIFISVKRKSLPLMPVLLDVGWLRYLYVLADSPKTLAETGQNLTCGEVPGNPVPREWVRHFSSQKQEVKSVLHCKLFSFQCLLYVLLKSGALGWLSLRTQAIRVLWPTVALYCQTCWYIKPEK